MNYAEKLVADLPIPAGAQILDLAGGRGALLFPAAEKAGDSGRLIGVDLSAEMVRLCAVLFYPAYRHDSVGWINVARLVVR